MRLLLIPLFTLLAACGTTQATMNEETGYIMVSRGKAGMLSWLTGSASYCKATKSNLEGVRFNGALVYEGDQCRIEVVGDNDAP